ncbi:MAG: glutathione synthase [Immundisolibacteraceae bacterium]|nr:glutathione synthase [Immundisolibacteraceae bacterium]
MSASQQRSVAVIMDPIEQITPYKDTSLAMMLEAQRRGWRVEYLQQSDIYMRDGVVFAQRQVVELFDDNDHWFNSLQAVDGPLSDVDLELMRKDPPVDDEYLYATYLLDRVAAAGTLVANPPDALRAVNEKLFAAGFSHCMAPTLVTSNSQRIRDFLAEHGDIILKPLNLMGGASIFRLTSGDPNVGVVLEHMTSLGSRSAMAQKFIPQITEGDKRILVIGGEPVPFALARIPAEGETRGNLAAGGRGVAVALSDQDRWIVDQVAPTLIERGLLFVGLDVIGDYLTEINVTSPTCVRELDSQCDLNIAGTYFDCLEQALTGS